MKQTLRKFTFYAMKLNYRYFSFFQCLCFVVILCFCNLIFWYFKVLYLYCSQVKDCADTRSTSPDILFFSSLIFSGDRRHFVKFFCVCCVLLPFSWVNSCRYNFKHRHAACTEKYYCVVRHLAELRFIFTLKLFKCIFIGLIKLFYWYLGNKISIIELAIIAEYTFDFLDE